MDYGARMYDGALGRFFTQDRFAEKYLDFTPYQYGANNPVLYIDVNGDSLRTYFYDEEGNRINSVPEKVQKMFNDEYGIKVGYNSKTGMLYFDSEVKTDQKVSETAKEVLMGALTDESTGDKSVKKFGTLYFGYTQDAFQGAQLMVTTANTGGKRNVYINLGAFNNDGSLNKYDYENLLRSGGSKRTFNLGRVFEHEWHGHVLNKKGDGWWSDRYPGGAARIVNQFREEMGLMKRLNYNTEGGIAFSFDTSRKSARRIFKSIYKGRVDSYIIKK